MPSALTDTLKIERCYQHGRGHLSRTKPGLLKLPKVLSVLLEITLFVTSRFYPGIYYKTSITLALGRLKYLIKFYFLSSHV